MTPYLLAAALVAGAAAAWRATLAWSRARLAAVEHERDDARAKLAVAADTLATRDRELQAARADVVHLREQLRQIAGRDPVAAADALDGALAGLRRPR